MTEIQTKKLASSLGTTGWMAGFMTASHLLTNPVPPLNEAYNRIKPYVDFSLSSSTYGEYSYIFTLEGKAAVSKTETELQSFYTDLLEKQERLGDEFEKVLFENLWTLYAR